MLRHLVVTAFAGLLIPSAQSHAQGDSVQNRLNTELRRRIDSLAAQDAFSGVVMVARNGKTIFGEAVGMANREQHLANTIDTKFNLGSMDKMFTGVAIAELVEKKVIALDDTVGKFLPDYPNADVRSHVTIRHLLTHSSGLGNYFQNGYLRNRTRIERASDLLPFFSADSLAFRPGARMAYSNAGFAVLGAIIEKVSGQTYFAYVKQHIFDVAGMTATAFDDASTAAPGRAVGYQMPQDQTGSAVAGARTPNFGGVEVRGGPAGGGFSNAHDMIAFGRALWSGKFASRTTMELFTTGVMPMGPGIKYAFGFGDLRLNGIRAVGHNGGAPGINAEFDSYPDLGYDVIVLSNLDPPSATGVMDRTREILMGAKGLARAQ